MKFYYYPKCSTCQKAKKWLEAHKLSFEVIDITKDRPTKDDFLNWFLTNKYESKKFFNTSGILYREGNYKEKLSGMSDEEKATLLATEGMLIKRPLLSFDGEVVLGFKESEYEAIFS